VLESYVTKRRNRKTALKLLRKSMKRSGEAKVIVTEKLRPYGTAMKVIGNASRQKTGRWLNNRAENSHLPFRRRERAMSRFRQMRSLQKFVAVHSSIHNHFNQERHLYSRANFKLNRTAALGRVARSMCSIGDSLTVPAQTGSHLSDTTVRQRLAQRCCRKILFDAQNRAREP
jgi:putative transposase